MRKGKCVAVVDCTQIFEDEDGFYMIEHYGYVDGARTVETSLGETEKELEDALADVLDWNYRAWRGEMRRILQAVEDVRKIKRSNYNENRTKTN